MVTTADLLLSNADMALQEAKRAGGGEARIYSLALGRQTRRAADMVGALVDALAQNQFRIAYQPIFSGGRRNLCLRSIAALEAPYVGSD